MSDHLKLPLYNALETAIDGKIKNALQALGKALPCSVVSASGTIVTVSFNVNLPWTLPQVTIPVVGWQWMRAPIQVGDEGYALPADLSLGQISGLGGSTAATSRVPANLSALVFMPVGNKSFVAVDPNAVTLYGPNGVVLQDTNAVAQVKINPTEINATIGTTSIHTDGTTITITAGASTIVATSSSVAITAAAIDLNGPVTIAGTLSQTGGGASSFSGNITGSGTVTTTGNITGAGIPLATHVHTGVQTGSGDTGGPIP